MSDITLVLCFCSMLLVPCMVASRNIRSKKDFLATDTAVVELSGRSTGLTEAELVAKRNRDHYYRRAS